MKYFKKIFYKHRKVYYLNELEFIDGYIWANIYYSNDVIIICPKTFASIKKINFLYLSSKANYIMKVIHKRSLA